MGKDYLPRPYAALLNWLINFIGYVVENLTRFGIPNSEAETFQAEVNSFETAYHKAENPNAGKADRLEREEKASAISKSARDFVNTHLRYNKSVTDDDRVKMGLNIPDTTPTPAPPPATMPEATLDSSIIMRLTVHYRDNGSSSKAKPSGIHGCEIRWAILSAPPLVTEDLIHSAFSTRTPHTFEFEEDQRGKPVYFRLRWQNTRGLKGPWSEIYQAIIP